MGLAFGLFFRAHGETQGSTCRVSPSKLECHHSHSVALCHRNNFPQSGSHFASTPRQAECHVIDLAWCGRRELNFIVWYWRTRHERRLWRTTRHDTATVAIAPEARGEGPRTRTARRYPMSADALVVRRARLAIYGPPLTAGRRGPRLRSAGSASPVTHDETTTPPTFEAKRPPPRSALPCDPPRRRLVPPRRSSTAASTAAVTPLCHRVTERHARADRRRSGRGRRWGVDRDGRRTGRRRRRTLPRSAAHCPAGDGKVVGIALRRPGAGTALSPAPVVSSRTVRRRGAK